VRETGQCVVVADEYEGEHEEDREDEEEEEEEKEDEKPMSEEILEKGSLAGLEPPPPSYMHMDKAKGWTDTQQWDGDDGATTKRK